MSAPATPKTPAELSKRDKDSGDGGGASAGLRSTKKRRTLKDKEENVNDAIANKLASTAYEVVYPTTR